MKAPKQQPRIQRRSIHLSYLHPGFNEYGTVETNDQIKNARGRKGYCLECQDVPNRLYRIERSKYNPLRTKRIPITVPGKSLNGQCLHCYPILHQKKQKPCMETNPVSEVKDATLCAVEADAASVVEDETYKPLRSKKDRDELISSVSCKATSMDEISEIDATIRDIEDADINCDLIIECLLCCIRENRNSGVVQLHCMLKILDLVRNNQAYKKSAISADAPIEIALISESYPNNGLIQECCAESLWRLCLK